MLAHIELFRQQAVLVAQESCAFHEYWKQRKELDNVETVLLTSDQLQLAKSIVEGDVEMRKRYRGLSLQIRTLVSFWEIKKLG